MRQLKIYKSITVREGEVLDRYLSDISRFPLISAEEEVELTRAMRKGGRKGEQAKEKLIASNLRFVVSVAKQYQHQGVPLPDLINEGNIGLMTAAERFDESRGFKFISYAIWRIRQSIQTAINEQGNAIRKPQNQITLESRIRRQINDFLHQYQRYPSEDELSELLKLTPSKVHQAQQSDTYTSSIDTPLGDDGSTTLADILSAGSESSADRNVDYESLCADLHRVLKATLEPKEQQIIAQSFGIGCIQRSLSDISIDMGLSRERVRQIQQRGLVKLRKDKMTKYLMRHLG